MSGVVVPIDGDIAPLLDQFARLPGRTQAEMDAVGRVIDAEITRGRVAKAFAELPGVSQKQAKKAANMLAREIDKGAREAEQSLAKMRQGAGAVFGGIVNDIDDVVGALEGMGPAGFAAAAAVGAVAAASAALVAGGALTKFLYDSADATGALEDEQRALDVALQDVQKTIGADVAPAFEQLLTVAVAGALATKDAAQALFDFRDDVIEWYKGAPALVRGAANAMSNNWLEMQANAETSNRALEDGTSVLGNYYVEARNLIGTLGDGDKGVAPALERTAAGVHQVSQEVQAALPHLDAMSVILRGEGEDDTSWLDAQIANTIENMPKATEAVQKYEGAGVALADSLGGAASAIGDLVGGLATEGSAAATAAIVIQKAAAIVSVTISTAQAVMQALATLGPIAGPIAAGAITATGVAQAALIAAQPESFHTGGIIAPDERLINARPGEGVLTSQGVQAAGGAAGVAAMNRGGSPAQSIVVVQQYQHRVFDAFVADNMARAGSPLGRAVRRGQRVGRASG